MHPLIEYKEISFDEKGQIEISEIEQMREKYKHYVNSELSGEAIKLSLSAKVDILRLLFFLEELRRECSEIVIVSEKGEQFLLYSTYELSYPHDDDIDVYDELYTEHVFELADYKESGIYDLGKLQTQQNEELVEVIYSIKKDVLPIKKLLFDGTSDSIFIALAYFVWMRNAHEIFYKQDGENIYITGEQYEK
jgi:hypothetical protein